MNFWKMHGLGNDYILMNDLEGQIADPAALARTLSRHHTGVGADGLILVRPSKTCDLQMRMFNADGSEGEMCGNGIRCLGRFAYESGLVRNTTFLVETAAGPRKLTLHLENGAVVRVQVDMGAPILTPREIPVAAGGNAFVEQPVQAGEAVYAVTCVSMGNPHAVLFVNDIETFPLARCGPALEHHPLFPKRINVEIVQAEGPNDLHMRVWERGSGETMACGTGACAAVVAGVLTGRCARRTVVHLPGGDLDINWDIISGHVLMTGPVETVYKGALCNGKDQ